NRDTTKRKKKQDRKTESREQQEREKEEEEQEEEEEEEEEDKEEEDSKQDPVSQSLVHTNAWTPAAGQHCNSPWQCLVIISSPNFLVEELITVQNSAKRCMAIWPHALEKNAGQKIPLLSMEHDSCK
ncbi:hypothetical protein lerEdw1_013503, partial [Lerista edwardsae]